LRQVMAHHVDDAEARVRDRCGRGATVGSPVDRHKRAAM
jgi:hypothetical protein